MAKVTLVAVNPIDGFGAKVDNNGKLVGKEPTYQPDDTFTGDDTDPQVQQLLAVGAAVVKGADAPSQPAQ